MTEEKVLENLILEVTGILKEMIIKQGEKMDVLHEDLIKVEALKEIVESHDARISRIENKVEQVCAEISADAAATKVREEFSKRDESRAYEEKKSLSEKIFDISTKLAGVIALIYLIAEKLF